ncbi:MAG: M23 family metallopeptidase [Clostridiales bacterium]|nr:M23 family metallopeptidase [Clostridiales bacterium]
MLGQKSERIAVFIKTILILPVIFLCLISAGFSHRSPNAAASPPEPGRGPLRPGTGGVHILLPDAFTDSDALVYLPPARPRPSPEGFVWPCEGYITSDFGSRWGSVHEGIDIAAAFRTPVYASCGGDVIFAGRYHGYGNLVKIKHYDGSATWYAHLSVIEVSEGDEVLPGDLIGLMGSTGYATGVHLHFEYHPEGGDPVDPIAVLPKR